VAENAYGAKDKPTALLRHSTSGGRILWPSITSAGCELRSSSSWRSTCDPYLTTQHTSSKPHLKPPPVHNSTVSPMDSLGVYITASRYSRTCRVGCVRSFWDLMHSSGTQRFRSAHHRFLGCAPRSSVSRVTVDHWAVILVFSDARG
jgi:hypothetical protein